MKVNTVKKFNLRSKYFESSKLFLNVFCIRKGEDRWTCHYVFFVHSVPVWVSVMYLYYF
jgi:hypothetical protein